jgi:hypothetical protein
MTEPARTLSRRIRDTLTRLEQDVDAWVASTDGSRPYLVPLSFLWDGATLLIATPAHSPTGRNLRATGRARIGIGHTRDVVIVDGVVAQALTAGEIPGDVGDAFAQKAGFDPRPLTSYVYFRILPERVQAWREVDELDGRDLMRDGRWLAD